ncbi:MAG: DUF5942 domain-containing protein, partial [Candidatus Xenobia bacterium]
KATAYKKGLDLEEGYGGGILQCDALVRHEVLGSGSLRLVIGALLIGLVGVMLQGRGVSIPGIATFLGLLIGGSGFFFLPYLSTKPIPFSEFLCRPLPLWDIPVLGLHQHANPLFYSCLIPLLLCLLLNGLSRLSQRFLVGLSAGVGAVLLHAVLSDAVVVRWVPHFLHLDTIWLVANAAACMLLAVAMAEAVRPATEHVAPPVQHNQEGDLPAT